MKFHCSLLVLPGRLGPPFFDTGGYLGKGLKPRSNSGRRPSGWAGPSAGRPESDAPKTSLTPRATHRRRSMPLTNRVSLSSKRIHGKAGKGHGVQTHHGAGRVLDVSHAKAEKRLFFSMQHTFLDPDGPRGFARLSGAIEAGRTPGPAAKKSGGGERSALLHKSNYSSAADAVRKAHPRRLSQDPKIKRAGSARRVYPRE